jgi:hypothetical protein
MYYLIMPRDFQLQFFAALGLLLILTGEYLDRFILTGLGFIITGSWIFLYKDVINQRETINKKGITKERYLRLNNFGLPLMSIIFIIAGVVLMITGDLGSFTLWPKQ